MPKLARALALAAVLAAMNLAAMTTVAQAHATDQTSGHDARRPPTEHQVRMARHQRRVSSPQQAAADAAHRRLLAQERHYSAWAYGDTSARAPAEPSGQPGWRTPALRALAPVLALVAGVAVMAARRANRTHRAGQTA